MSRPDSTPSPETGEPQSGQLREILTDAIRYWERRRIVYNFLLAAVGIIWIAATWPHFRPVFTWSSLLALVVLAMVANLCYCAAYVADLPMQLSSFRSPWRHWRWSLWLTGMLFAILLTNYWIADEIYSFVH